MFIGVGSAGECGRVKARLVRECRASDVGVVRVDGEAIGTGRPGPVVGGLSRAYASFVEGAARPAI